MRGCERIETTVQHSNPEPMQQHNSAHVAALQVAQLVHVSIMHTQPHRVQCLLLHRQAIGPAAATALQAQLEWGSRFRPVKCAAVGMSYN